MKRLNSTTALTAKIAVGVVSLAALASCGLKGDLERPDPMWGDPPIDGPDDPRVAKTAEEAMEDQDEEDVPDDELLGGVE